MVGSLGLTSLTTHIGPLKILTRSVAASVPSTRHPAAEDRYRSDRNAYFDTQLVSQSSSQ